MTVKKEFPMKAHVDWLQILVRCKDNVKTHIRPLLKTLSEPQPDLGEGAGGDPMKLVDLAAEKAIVEVLQQYSKENVKVHIRPLLKESERTAA